MDSVEMSSNGECIEDATAEVLLPSELANGYDVFGEPEVQPRVGEEYQAEIPAFISESEISLFERDNVTAREPHFFHGLPIPVMWVREGVDTIKHEKHEFAVGSDKPSVSLAYGNSTVKVSDKVKCEEPEDSIENSEKKGYFLAPGSQYSSWNMKDEANFLLSLYIFGKNLVQVRRFMENKSIGETMSYYYGRFYGTAKYKRWSMCRKMKSRKCIYGQKIFAGLRQQELISRLSSHLSEECRSKLQEASRSFGEGKTSLEEYVFALKDTAGLSRLVEAVGIGKGKQDLTGIGMEQTKPTQTAALFPEVPVGKACSTLSTAEIVTFLTGNFRLSKAKSNDLFWEAVWPRLLARGWHSEQPDNGGSRHSLVFLVPGVKKFSKRKLVKGEHFFDSVTDVLNKVGLQPNLLDLEADVVAIGGQEWAHESKSDGEDSSDEEERHCYLKPRTLSLSGNNPMKFTIVDTSMVIGGDRKACKLRELRSLPPEISKPGFRNHFGGECNGDVHQGEKMDESNSAGSSSFSRHEADAIPKPLSKANVGKDFTQKRKTSELQPKRRTKATTTKIRQKGFLSNCSERRAAIVEILSSTTTSPSKENPSTSNEFGNPNPNPLWTMIDLNLPVCPAAEFSGQGGGGAADSQHDLTKQPSNSEQQQQPSMNQRRQSTRNRPLTTKALEALAFGLYESKKKRKNRDDLQQEMVMVRMPRPPRRGGKGHQPEESYSANFVDLTVEEKGCGESGDGDGETNVFSDDLKV